MLTLRLFLAVLSLATYNVSAQPGPQAGSGPASANLWVDTNGGTCSRQSTAGAYSDSGACSSMQTALTAASAGDVIVIRNGTYGTQNLSSGEKASTVTFHAQTYGSVLVPSLGVSVDRVAIYGVIASGTGNGRGTLSVTKTGSGGVLIDGFRARTIWMTGNYITIQNGEFCGGSGSSAFEEDCVKAWSGVSNITFKNNIFHDWSSSYDVTYHNDFIQFYPSGTNVTIDGNLFYNGPTSNIMTGGGALTNWVIQNNYFGTPINAGNGIVYGNSSTPCSGLTYRNNVDASGLAINNVDCSGLNPDVSGNIYLSAIAAGTVYGSVSGGYNVFPVSGGATFGSNSRRCAPTFLNGTPSSGNGYDIRLSNSDTCAKDHGNPSSYSALDAYGTTRPINTVPDAGAFEAGGEVPDTTAPAVSSAAISANGTTLTLGLSEPVSIGVGGNGGLSLSCASGSRTATYVSGSGSLSLVYSIPIVRAGETCTRTYTQPGNGIEDIAGNDLLSFSSQAMTNGSTQQFTVTGSAGANGSISPSSRSVNYNATTTFTVTPNSGYSASASGCGGSLVGATYTTGVITANCTVSATFTSTGDTAPPTLSAIAPASGHYTIALKPMQKAVTINEPGACWTTDSKTCTTAGCMISMGTTNSLDFTLAIDPIPGYTARSSFLCQDAAGNAAAISTTDWSVQGRTSRWRRH